MTYIKHKALLLIAAGLTIQSTIVSGHTLTPVNNNADNTTKAMYNWLGHLPNRSNEKLLSGAFGGYTNIGGDDVFSTQESDDIYSATNPAQRPAIYACDYARGWNVSDNIANLIDDSCNNDLIVHWQQGGLVQISNHLPNPVAVHKWGVDNSSTPYCSANYVLSVNPADSGKQYGMQDTDGLQDSVTTMLANNQKVKLYKNKCRIQSNSNVHQWGLAANGYPSCSYDYKLQNPNDTADNWGFQDTDSNGSGNTCFIPSVDKSGFGGGLKTHISDAQYNKILDRNSAIGKRWKATMDKVADGLESLKNSGVTVIYRPLHEMNGDWFWWGPKDRSTVSQARKNLYKNLYQDMYNYFTNTRYLNNLIWVYSPDAGPGRKTEYYPGVNFVDIVGLDAYNDSPATISGYNELLTFGKPFAFAEVGPKTLNGSFDYENLINTIQSQFPKAIYIIPWNAGWSPLNNIKINELFNHSWMANKGDIWDQGNLSTILEAPTTLFDFESGNQGWLGVNVLGGPWAVTDWANRGTKSIKADLALSNGSTYVLNVPQNRNLQGKQNLAVDVKLANWGNVGTQGLIAKLYIKTGNSWTWSNGEPVEIKLNQLKTLSFDLSNVTNLDQVKEVGVHFFLASGSGQTAVYLDNVRVN